MELTHSVDIFKESSSIFDEPDSKFFVQIEALGNLENKLFIFY